MPLNDILKIEDVNGMKPEFRGYSVMSCEKVACSLQASTGTPARIKKSPLMLAFLYYAGLVAEAGERKGAIS